ncbi:MAG: hypothetical protein H6Q25_783 [Bacteroidetes bacterium]|nr:hypothetical protein [Bacteroidota bacterium]
MNKKQAFKIATFLLLTILFFSMPAFINEVPVQNFGPITKILIPILHHFFGPNTDLIVFFQFVNIAFIWLIILEITRFLKLTVGWRAALFGVLLLALCPRFIGASIQNLVDIPFAFFYLFSVTQIYSFCREIPRIKFKRLIFLALGTLVTSFIHPAGFVLVIYLVVFVAIAVIFKYNSRWNKTFNKNYTIVRISIYSTLLILAIFVTSWISVHYFYNQTLLNPFQALKMLNWGDMNQNEIFESKLLNSNQLPHYYLVKYLFISIPIVILIGIFLLIAFFKKMKNELNPHIHFVIIGSLIFPLIFTFFAKMNHQGFWAVYYFTVPLLVVTAIIGTESLLRKIDDRYVNTVISMALFLLILPPFRHVLITAPATSLYFNEFAGGVSTSYGKYTLDLNSHYPEIASKWLIKNIYSHNVRDFKDNDTILVLTDAKIDCSSFFKKNKYLKVKHGTYKQFSEGLGEYYISFGNNVDPAVLKAGLWPPKNSFYTIKVDDAPIVAFIKKEVK